MRPNNGHETLVILGQGESMEAWSINKTKEFWT